VRSTISRFKPTKLQERVRHLRERRLIEHGQHTATGCGHGTAQVQASRPTALNCAEVHVALQQQSRRNIFDPADERQGQQRPALAKSNKLHDHSKSPSRRNGKGLEYWLFIQ